MHRRFHSRERVNRHALQHMRPQEVSVAACICGEPGGKNHMGQVYPDRGSSAHRSGCVSEAEGAGTGGMVEVEVEVLGLLWDFI